MTLVKDSLFEITKTDQSRLEEVDFNNIPFGRIFSDHMLVADYSEGKWGKPKIVPWQKLNIFPCASALHYGQSVFEGMKAFRMESGEVALFRPEENFNRLNFSARRMCMPEIPEEIFMEGLKTLLDIDREWVPGTKGASLYVRPFMFATDEYVGIKPSDNYKFIIFSCPVGAYYPEPVKLLVLRDLVRAFEGGTGEAKAAGNYGGSLLGNRRAKQAGYDNVLWLDGVEHKYIEECGTMNVFFVIDGVVVTPELDGTILRGITRKSSIEVLKKMGIQVQERKITIDEVVQAHKDGKLEEVFGAGTAATIAHVSKIGVDGEDLELPPISERKVGPALLDALNGIRKGTQEDSFGWMVKV